MKGKEISLANIFMYDMEMSPRIEQKIIGRHYFVNINKKKGRKITRIEQRISDVRLALTYPPTLIR